MAAHSRSVLIGVSPYEAGGGAARRQAAALGALGALDRATALNVQFRDAPYHVPGIETLPALVRDSNTVTGRQGPRKPLVAEILDALAGEAASRGADMIGFANADVVVSGQAVDYMLDAHERGHQACAFSRRDLDAVTGEPTSIQIAGVDVIAVSAAWWRAHRGRFRDYIAGESTWDNVYTAILMCHAGGVIENRQGLVRHEAHAAVWRASPFVQYTRLLAALDAPYFSLWCEYCDRLHALRSSGPPPVEDVEAALAREVFAWQPGPLDRAIQAGRHLKAVVRYAWHARR